MHPAPEPAGHIDVSSVTKIDQFAAPKGRVVAALLERHIRVIEARDDKAWKRQGGFRHRSEADGTRVNIFCPIEMTGRNKQCAADCFSRCPTCKMRSQQATKAVCDEYNVAVLSENRFKTREPSIQMRPVPVVLLHEARAWMVGQPVLLPMVRSRPHETRQDKCTRHRVGSHKRRVDALSRTIWLEGRQTPNHDANYDGG